MYKGFIGVMVLAMMFIAISYTPANAEDATTTATTTETTATTTDESSATTTDDSTTTEDTTTNEDTSTTESGLLARLQLLKNLLAQLTALQTKFKELTGQIKEVRSDIRSDLHEGVAGDDVEKIQELLASDPTLYPEGLKTGYFGRLTKEAVKRFQVRHELEVTGMIDAETKALLEQYFADIGNAGIPAGFLRAPGIKDKIERKFAEGCDHQGEGKGSFCNKVKMKFKLSEMKDKKSDNSDDEEMDDDSGHDSSDDADDDLADDSNDDSNDDSDNSGSGN